MLQNYFLFNLILKIKILAYINVSHQDTFILSHKNLVIIIIEIYKQNNVKTLLLFEFKKVFLCLSFPLFYEHF